MRLSEVVENIGTITELKRIASAYVIDYRNLSDDEIKSAIIRTAPQYYYSANLQKTTDELFLNPNRTCRILSRMILKKVLLEKDSFMCPKRETEDEIIALQQDIVDRSNEDLLRKGSERNNAVEFFKFVLETAWERHDDISPDEKNLIEKVKERLKITDTEHQIIEAKLGKYPKPGNELHTRGEIEEIRRLMQSRGLLFAIRDKDNTDFDLIPEEVAGGLRKLLGMEVKQHGYEEILNTKFVRSKKYLHNILDKSGIVVERWVTMEDLRKIFLEQVRPSILLGGISPRDGLDITVLRKWCSELNLNVSGTKADLIQRIVAYYDNILKKDDSIEDEREIWYQHYDKFASRDLEFLRNQQLIQKDLECEAKFEEATKYLFEKKLRHKPLKLVGTAHADGAVSFQDKVIYWDNKSKEGPVNLKDYLRQFDGYIKSSEKTVACFFVIGPDFTPESILLAMQYQVQNGTTVLLVTAEELKEIAEDWSSKGTGKQEDPFPLGYLIQPGRLNKNLLGAL